MGREISFFADYRQGENSLTNYCGLIMKLLYEESPRQFQELLIALLETDSNIIVGPAFTQQTKNEKSIPDLSINQQSFSIIFETKTTDWFYEDQIKRHIDGIDKTIKHKILFLLSNFESNNFDGRFKDWIAEAKENGIILQPISVEDFVGSLEHTCKTEYLKNLLEEFKIYLDRKDLLPKWKKLLDVVNCTASKEEINEGVYICPNTGGAYSHRRAKYFGPYSNKEVSAIYEITAVVIIDTNIDKARISWKNDDSEDNELERRAKEKVKNLRIKENETTPLQVFLLDKKAKTRFIKDSSGGMQQSKRYFWDIANDCNNSEELAAKLQDQNWSQFKN